MPGQSLAVGLPIADRRRAADFYRAFLQSDPFGAIADDGLPEPLQFRVNTDTTILLIPSTGFNWVLQMAPSKATGQQISEARSSSGW